MAGDDGGVTRGALGPLPLPEVAVAGIDVGDGELTGQFEEL